MSYTLNDIQYPSVSVIRGQLDKSYTLIPWALNCMGDRIMKEVGSGQWYDENEIDEFIQIAKKEYKTVSDEAKDIGSQVHNAIESYIKYDIDVKGKLKDEVENGFLAFLEWENKNVDEWLESEIKTVNVEHGYAGTYDAIFRHKNGRIVMIDFKTSKAIYDEYWTQLCAYKASRESLHGEYSIFFDRGETATFEYNLPPIKIDDLAVLRLDKVTGEPQYKTMNPKRIEPITKSFFLLTEYYYHAKKRKLKNNPIVQRIWS